MNNKFRFFAVILVFVIIFMVGGSAATYVQAASLEYDATYKSASIFSSLGDKTINYEVKITVELVASVAGS